MLEYGEIFTITPEDEISHKPIEVTLSPQGDIVVSCIYSDAEGLTQNMAIQLGGEIMAQNVPIGSGSYRRYLTLIEGSASRTPKKLSEVLKRFGNVTRLPTTP